MNSLDEPQNPTLAASGEPIKNQNPGSENSASGGLRKNQNSKIKNRNSAQLSTLNSKPSTAPPLPRLYGRVARLPADIRRRINEMLDDHVPFAEIIKNLGDHGTGLTLKCIRGWKARGYRHYLQQQALIEQCHARTEHAFELALKAGSVPGFQATQQIASAQILEVISDLGPDILKEAVLANPMNYFRMLSAFTRISNAGIRCERHLADDSARQAQAKVAESTAPEPKKGLSRETFQTLNHELNLM